MVFKQVLNCFAARSEKGQFRQSATWEDPLVVSPGVCVSNSLDVLVFLFQFISAMLFVLFYHFEIKCWESCLMELYACCCSEESSEFMAVKWVSHFALCSEAYYFLETVNWLFIIFCCFAMKKGTHFGIACFRLDQSQWLWIGRWIVWF